MWDEVKSELTAGHKRTHWMWFVFPQLAALGRSGTARFYGLADADEARTYVAHPVLGPRLLECCELLMRLPATATAVGVFGDIDAMKLRSCLTLFDAVGPGLPCIDQCLAKFFAGERDPLTLSLLAR